MAYTPTIWKDGEAPAINAENLNKIEQGIANTDTAASQALDAAQKAEMKITKLWTNTNTNGNVSNNSQIDLGVKLPSDAKLILFVIAYSPNAGAPKYHYFANVSERTPLILNTPYGEGAYPASAPFASESKYMKLECHNFDTNIAVTPTCYQKLSTNQVSYSAMGLFAIYAIS